MPIPNDTRPANELSREEYAARAGVPVSQITGTFGNFMVGSAVSSTPTNTNIRTDASGVQLPDLTAEELAAARIANNPNAPPADPYQTQLEGAYAGVSGILTSPQETEEQIRQRTRTSMQAYIDAINQEYAGIVAREQEAGVGRLGMTRAITARSGTLGEGFGEQAMETTRGKTREVIAAYEAEKGSKIAKANADIMKMASDEIKSKKLEALGYLKELSALRETNQTKSLDIAKGLAQQGKNYTQLPEETYRMLLKNSGMDELSFQAFWDSNRKKADQVDYSDSTVFEGENGNAWIVRSGFDPITGGAKTQKGDLGIPYDQYKAEGKPDIKEVDGIFYTYDKATKTMKAIGGTRTPEKLTESEKLKYLKTQAIAKARPELEKSKGTDGYIDPDVYMRLRVDWAEAIGTITDFDNTFAGMLSPTERARLGVGKAAGVEAVSEGDSEIPAQWR